MTDVSYSDNVLRIGDKEVELDYPIKKVMEEDGLILVLMNPPTDKIMSGNIEAYNYQSEKVWQIKDLRTDLETQGDATYMTLEKRDGKVVSHNWGGGTYEIDLETGDVDLIDYDPK